MTVKVDGNSLAEGSEAIFNLLESVLINMAKSFAAGYLQGTIPDSFNKFVWDSEGFIRLGAIDNVTFSETGPLAPWANLTIDCQLDPDFLIMEDFVHFGINGTVFNNDTGYKLPGYLESPTTMPLFDPSIPADFQLFISNWFIDSLFRAYFEKPDQVFEYTLFGDEYQDPPCPFNSNTLEGIFPFTTMKFGENITADVKIILHNITNFSSITVNKTDLNNQSGEFFANMYLEAEAILRYKNGTNYSLGFAEFHGVNFSSFINQTNQTVISLWFHYCNVTGMWLNTSYIGRYESSPLVMNWAMYVLLDLLNVDYMTIPFPEGYMVDMNTLTVPYFSV